MHHIAIIPVIVKRLYQHSHYNQLCNLINCRNVVKTPKDDFHACDDFFRLVLQCPVITATYWGLRRGHLHHLATWSLNIFFRVLLKQFLPCYSGWHIRFPHSIELWRPRFGICHRASYARHWCCKAKWWPKGAWLIFPLFKIFGRNDHNAIQPCFPFFPLPSWTTFVVSLCEYYRQAR